MKFFANLLRNESGATTLEVTMIVALMIVIVISAATTIGHHYCP